MTEHEVEGGASGGRKATLVAKIDGRVFPSLDRLASTNQISVDQMMSGFFSDISDAVEFVGRAQGVSPDTVEDWFAKLIIKRCPDATSETLKAMAQIWERAAVLKTQEVRHKS